VIIRPDAAADRDCIVAMIASRIKMTPEALVGAMPFELLASVSDDGRLMGAVLYTNYRSGSIEMTQAGVPGWLTLGSLRTLFGYPFLQLGCRRVGGLVHRKNRLARDINERLGFRMEGVLKDAFPNGDGILYGMTRSECRWIRDKRNGQERTEGT
jgi:RimJ/RimL family protein N-acetyltransferase